MNLRELIDAVRNEGYSQANAEARVCQDSIIEFGPEKQNQKGKIYGAIFQKAPRGHIPAELWLFEAVFPGSLWACC